MSGTERYHPMRCPALRGIILCTDMRPCRYQDGNNYAYWHYYPACQLRYRPIPALGDVQH
eukprot:148310-Rhodomonas_salina.6